MVHTGIGCPHWEFQFPETVVEVRDELIQIPLQTIPGNPLECAKQKGLQVTNGDVYPGQPLVHLVRFSHASLMFLTLFQSLQRYQSVGTGGLFGTRAPPRELANPVRRDRPGFPRQPGSVSCPRYLFRASYQTGVLRQRRLPVPPGPLGDRGYPDRPWRSASDAASGGP